jgi:excisionase family DNA binding protein
MSKPSRPEVAGRAAALTIDEACAALRICRATIYELMNRGELQYFQIPGMSRRRIPASEIERIIGTTS